MSKFIKIFKFVVDVLTSLLPVIVAHSKKSGNDARSE